MPADTPATPDAGSTDSRLYAPTPEGFVARILTSADRTYCFYKHPGEDHFHLLLRGEVILERGDEQMCLNCALRNGYLTRNRMFWQHSR